VTYQKLAIKGTSWFGGLRVFTRGVLFLKLAVLARVLTPSDFGAFGIASLVLALLEVLSETGINTVLIQSKKSIRYYLDTAFLISVFRGFSIAFLIALFAPFVARFFDAPDTLKLLYLISLVPLIRGFINPSIISFAKELKFAKESALRGVLYLIDALVAITISLITRSPSGFIWGMIVASVCEVVLSMILIKPRPGLAFEKEKFKYIMSHGKWVTGFGILQYFYREGDDVVVGRLLGQSSLGIYQTAYKISTMPVSEVADVLTRVTFPIYVKIADDKTRLLRAFKKTFSLSLLGSLAFGMIIIVFPQVIVQILLGDQWFGAVELIQILAVFGILKSAINSFDSLFLATKNQKYITISSFVGTAVMLISIIPMIHAFGVNGAGYATIVSVVVALPVSIYFARRIFI